jgi:hypothetical protein
MTIGNHVNAHSSNEELQKYFLENTCNETTDRGKYRLFASAIFFVLSVVSIVSYKSGFTFPYQKVLIFLFVGICSTQYLQGTTGV